MPKLKFKVIAAATPGCFKPAMLRPGDKEWIPINTMGIGSKEDARSWIKSWKLEMRLRPDLLHKKVVRAHEAVKRAIEKHDCLQGEYAEMMGKIWPDGK